MRIPPEWAGVDQSRPSEPGSLDQSTGLECKESEQQETYLGQLGSQK